MHLSLYVVRVTNILYYEYWCLYNKFILPVARAGIEDDGKLSLFCYGSAVKVHLKESWVKLYIMVYRLIY